MDRIDGRKPDQLRPLRITTGYLPWAEGSALIDLGDTQVLCACSVEDRLPNFLRGSGSGWVTAEYGMLPRSTKERTQREASAGRPSGRTQEIQRLIGRSLRAVIDLDKLGERTFWIDCDVLQADAGTRTASITAGYIALALAVRTLQERGTITKEVLPDTVAAVSAGMVGGRPILDLSYEEDAVADVDFNVVMTGSGRLVEIQGTAEGRSFSRDDLEALVDLAEAGIRQLTELQRQVLRG